MFHETLRELLFLVQVICDADLFFINVIAKWPGSVHDARILRQSVVFENCEGTSKILIYMIYTMIFKLHPSK